jgi:hypothetical protein
MARGKKGRPGKAALFAQVNCRARRLSQQAKVTYRLSIGYAMPTVFSSGSETSTGFGRKKKERPARNKGRPIRPPFFFSYCYVFA